MKATDSQGTTPPHRTKTGPKSELVPSEEHIHQIRQILACTCSFNDTYNGRSWNIKTEEYEDCGCIEQIPQIISLINEARIDELNRLLDIYWEQNRYPSRSRNGIRSTVLKERLKELNK